MADVGPVLMDGAMGTLLWQLAQEAGVERKPVWTYNIDHPDLVRQAHRCYLEAGSELILANTFGANRLAVMRGEMQVSDVIRTGMRLAGETAGAYGARAALDLGPLTELLEPYGDLEAETCAGLYREMVDTGLEAGADCVVLETFMDLEMLRIAAEQALGRGVPVLCAMTFEAGGRTLMGNTVEQVAEALEPMGVAAVGVNCSLGPAQALPAPGFRCCSNQTPGCRRLSRAASERAAQRNNLPVRWRRRWSWRSMWGGAADAMRRLSAR